MFDETVPSTKTCLSAQTVTRGRLMNETVAGLLLLVFNRQSPFSASLYINAEYTKILRRLGRVLSDR